MPMVTFPARYRAQREGKSLRSVSVDRHDDELTRTESLLSDKKCDS